MTDKLQELAFSVERLIESKRGELKALDQRIAAAEETLRELTEQLEGLPEKKVLYDQMKQDVRRFVADLDAAGIK